jgi:hypothetical protein
MRRLRELDFLSYTYTYTNTYLRWTQSARMS